MNIEKKLIGVVIGLCLGIKSWGTHAAGITTSRIAELGIIPSTNVLWIKVAGPVTTPATCAIGNYFVTNFTTEAGKATYKLVLAAQVQSLPLTVYGTGACSIWSGSEDIQYVWIDPPTS